MAWTDWGSAGVASYVIGRNWLLLAGTLSGFIVRGFVPPEVFGAYFFAVTLSGYLSVLNTPLGNLVDVQVPLLIGRGPNNEAKNVARDSYSLLGLMVLAEAAVLLIASIWVDRPWLRVSLVVIAIVSALDAITNADYLLLRSYRRFSAFGIAALLRESPYSVSTLALLICGARLGSWLERCWCPRFVSVFSAPSHGGSPE